MAQRMDLLTDQESATATTVPRVNPVTVFVLLINLLSDYLFPIVQSHTLGAYSAVRAEQEGLTRGVLAILTQSANLQFVIQLFAVLKLLVTNISIPRLSRKVLSASTRLLV